MNKLLLSFIPLTIIAWAGARAEEGAEEDEALGRVKYALILPEEKTPELVKDTENNPFESNANLDKEEGTTEENLVREILLRMPAVGGAAGSQGMRVMLGGMRLVEGGLVPAVLPDQQVSLKVKSISSTAIELVWVEKKETALPPKILTIPLDVAPKVRHQLPTAANVKGAPTASIGTIRRNGVPVLVSPGEAGYVPPSAPPFDTESELAAAASDVPPPAADDSLPPPDPLPPAGDLPQASVLRMLFGNHAPAGK